MSFITETYKCKECGVYINVALGTFGYGMPTECDCGATHSFEHIAAGWHADENGKWKEDSPI